MADAKDCPDCGLVNSPTAVRCDCGYDFAIKQVVAPTGCQLCGAEGELREVAFYQQIGAIVLRFKSGVEGWLCKACVEREFWGRTIVTLLLGWWGVLSFFLTPLVVMGNVVHYLRCRGMAPPTSRPAAHGSGAEENGSPAQLVGQTCILCGKRIPFELDAEFCRGCGSPVHHWCARPGEGPGCRACGAAVPGR